jgi:putative hydrolase of the HAD superfamily
MAIEVVLFDLGGVLVELGGVGEMARFAGEDSEDELWRRWLECPWVRRFERGQCDAESFSHGMVEAWSLTVGPREFLEAFEMWPRGLLPGAHELVRSVATTIRVGCLSNTNSLHAQRQWTEFGIGELFHEHFFSHEMGLVKPDREAFDHVLAALERPGDRVLFLDDNQINVDGARAAGLRAERARGPSEARAVLEAFGLRAR